jgi:hypothetical protein
VRVVLTLRGHQPKVSKSKGELVWRQAIADRILQQFPNVAPFTTLEGTRFHIEAEFHLVASQLLGPAPGSNPPDLDNLVKPVLDTLFQTDGAREPTERLIHANDTFVFTLMARKTLAYTPAGEGLDVVVTWEEQEAVSLQ